MLAVFHCTAGANPKISRLGLHSFIYCFTVDSVAEQIQTDATENGSILDREDEATLAAIDKAIQQADEGKLISADDMRELIPEWITKFSTPQQL